MRLSVLSLHATVSSLAMVLLCTFMPQAQAKQDFQEINWDTLDLSPKQRQQMNSLNQQWKSCVSDAAPKIKENEKKLQSLITVPKPDEKKIMALQQSIHEDKTKLKLEATEIFLQKRKVLNKDQHEKLLKMLKRQQVN